MSIDLSLVTDATDFVVRRFSRFPVVQQGSLLYQPLVGYSQGKKGCPAKLRHGKIRFVCDYRYIVWSDLPTPRRDLVGLEEVSDLVWV